MTDVKKIAEVAKEMSDVSKRTDSAVRELKAAEMRLAKDCANARSAIDVKYKAKEVERLRKEMSRLQSDYKKAERIRM